MSARCDSFERPCPPNLASCSLEAQHGHVSSCRRSVWLLQPTLPTELSRLVLSTRISPSCRRVCDSTTTKHSRLALSRSFSLSFLSRFNTSMLRFMVLVVMVGVGYYHGSCINGSCVGMVVVGPPRLWHGLGTACGRCSLRAVDCCMCVVGQAKSEPLLLVDVPQSPSSRGQRLCQS